MGSRRLDTHGYPIALRRHLKQLGLNIRKRRTDTENCRLELLASSDTLMTRDVKIGRASCRERV